jgi:hypothetical protein
MKIVFAAIVFTLALGGIANAQSTAAAAAPAAPKMKFAEACGADIQSLCPTAQSRKDKHKCIRSNREKISQTCHAFLVEKHAEKKAAKQAQQTAATAPSAGQVSPH